MKKTYRIESSRLKNWDYSSEGAYYITLNTKRREHSFGKIENGKMILSEIGQIAHDYWQQIPIHSKTASIDEFIIMPDHIHGIIFLDYSENDSPISEAEAQVSTDGVIPRLNPPRDPIPRLANQGGALPRLNASRKSISTIIGTFKSIFTKTINQKFPKEKFQWQERFYDHIIRHEDDLNRIRKYIIANPAKWELKKGNNNLYKR